MPSEQTAATSSGALPGSVAGSPHRSFSQAYKQVLKAANAAGVKPKLKVLYVPDYVSSVRRVDCTSTLWKELSRLMPEYDVSIGLSEGPLEDDEGTSSHFDRKALTDRWTSMLRL